MSELTQLGSIKGHLAKPNGKGPLHPLAIWPLRPIFITANWRNSVTVILR